MLKSSENKFLKLGFRNYFVEWFLLIIALIIIGIFTAYTLILGHENIYKREENRLTTQAKILNDNLSAQLHSIKESLLSVRDKLEKTSFDNPNNLFFVTEQLKTFVKILPTLRTFVVIDKTGKPIASNREDILTYNYKEREYFVNIQNNPDRDQFFVSTPYKTVLGAWTLNIGVPYFNTNGEFAGIIVAVFEPEELKKLLNSVLYASDMVASIIHGDGTLFLMTPYKEETLGVNLNKAGTLYSNYLNSGKSIITLRGEAYIFKKETIVSFHIVKPEDVQINKAIYVAVSRDIDSIYASFENEFFIITSLYLVLLLTSIPGLYFIQKRRYISKLIELEAEDMLKQRLESFAYLDSLTEIPNRRYFDQVFDQEWRYCLRNKKELSIILVDIDFFKSYNDTYGHQAGDVALKKVAQALHNSLNRSHDLAARYGGEEFICVLPDTSLEGAQIKAERLRADVENLNIPHENSKTSNVVTISLGIASIVPRDDMNPSDLLKMADEALYISKKDGRNRVSFKI